MPTLVLNSRAISVKLESEHLVIKRHAGKKEAEVSTLPLVEVDRILVVGRPAVSFAVLAECLARGIPCVFTTRGGRWRGVLDNGCGTNAERRMRQYALAGDAVRRLELARGLVAAKLRNARRVIQRLSANRGMKLDPRDERWVGLSGCAGMAAVAGDLDAVRGQEGLGSFFYFRLLADFFPKGVPFPARSRRPPLDAANAALSFAYTSLLGAMVAAVRLHGLDVAIGFLHEDRRTSPALALDLMEPFRPAFADLLVLDLFNHGRLTPEKHFRTDSKTGGVYLEEEGRSILLGAGEEALERLFKPYGSDNRISMRGALELQVCEFVKAVEEGASPTFFRLA